MSEPPQRDIPLQKVSSVSHRSSQAGVDPARRGPCGQGPGGLCMSVARNSHQTTPPRIPSIRESVFWSRFCCGNALLLVSINIFLYAYFA